MRTSELCNTWKKAATRWPSIWERAGDILFSKSSRQRKASLDGRFDERSDHGGRAILRFWWPIRRKLKECWDGPPSAISPTSSRVRGPGCRKHRAVLERSPSGFSSCRSRSVSHTLPRMKPYQRIAFQYERVFETMALACGKKYATESQCRFSRKTS